ncbi:hypothetical protein KPL78_27140 [Roseomonas sp. HJA6]|uniref:Alkaline proteinase inhibitor/ Outer membrane lipoprotein Omp19 domain-containing protein n=1 Tax=Roseomonas alba TaxID=2846776 RepID=A0ABS7AGW7_9PROT|nr:hypothetical protein [Neoroseomonas alba]MBW6401556.1 hypothetical protein [Neoroseomonas alba]
MTMILRAWTAAAVLAGLATVARAEDAAALLARAPALSLDGPVTSLTAPVEVAQAGWGPFRRLCVAQVLLRPSDGAEVAAAPPTCFTVEDARNDNGTWRLSLRAELGGAGPDIPIAVTRDATGHFGQVRITVPEGVPPIPPPQLERLHAVMQAAVQAHGLERATIAPNMPFVIPLPISAVNPGMHVDGGGFTCSPEGQGQVRGRSVIVASCQASLSAEVSPGRSMRITAAGHFAIDVETGLVLRHGYGSFLVLDADPNGSMGRTEMRGVSRQSLQ